VDAKFAVHHSIGTNADLGGAHRMTETGRGSPREVDKVLSAGGFEARNGLSCTDAVEGGLAAQLASRCDRPQGARKYPTSTLLRSSAGLGWSIISAELRSHEVSETPIIVPQTVELCLAVAGNDQGLVIRTGAGQRQQTKPSTGAIWLSPIGVADNQIAIKAPIPRTLHLHLPASLFRRLADDFNLPGAPAHSIRYAAGVRDEIITQIGLSIISTMTNETAAGRMFVETASAALAARLLQTYADSGSSKSLKPTAHQPDQARLRRVLDHISMNLDSEIALAQLAEVAGLSVFHFARTFTRAMGVSPSRYVSRMRLEKAMAEIAAGKLPLAEIAFKAGFSSQASFTRAFYRVTGLTPGEYRRHRR
jgi:AraC family transcriptional regulator